jgi:hypothetical protein
MNHFVTTFQIFVIILIVATTVFSGCGEKEEKISLSEVPEVVLTAAQNAVEGIEITEAEIEKTSEGMIYELEGTADGKIYEIEVSPDGKIIEVEQEGDEDQDKNKDDDEDEDDNGDEDEHEDHDDDEDEDEDD